MPQTQTAPTNKPKTGGAIYRVAGPVVTAQGITARMYDVVFVGNERLMGEVIEISGDKTVIHAIVDVTFKDDMGQTAQRDELPLRVLRTGGPYDEAVDLNISPLAPGQSKPFRLTFESISAQWNHQFPEIQVVDVTTK